MASSRATLGPSSSYHPGSSTASNAHDNGTLSVSDQLMQLDLAITSTLQEIDANFARAHQLVTAQLLPAVKVYGQHSVKTWQSAKFWQDFFITAAQVPLKRSEEGETSQGYDANDQSGYGDNSGYTREDSPGYDQSTSQDGSPMPRGAGLPRKGRRTNDSQADDSFNEDDLYRNGRNARASPAPHQDPEASWASVDSVFDRLKREMATEPADSTLSRAENRLAQHRANKDARERALLENGAEDGAGTDVNGLTETAKGLAVSKGKSGAPSVFRSPAKLHHGTPKLLNKVLNAEQKKADTKQRTPGAGEPKSNPFQLNGAGSSKWNGIADLRETPLAKNKTRSKGGASSKKANTGVSTPQRNAGKAWYDDSDDDIALPPGMSPPVTMQFSVARSRYDKTPAKEAARHIVADVLRTCEGPSTVARDRQRLLQQQQANAANAASPAAYLRAGKTGVTASNSVVASPLKKGPAGPQKRRDSMPTPPTLTKTLKTDKTPAGVSAAGIPGSAASSAAASGHRAARLFDEGEEGGEDARDDSNQLRAGPSGSFASAHSVADDDEDDSEDDDNSLSDESDEDEARPAGSVQSSVSKNLSTFSTTNSTTTSSFSRSGWSSSSNASGGHHGGGGASMDNDTLFGVGKLSTRGGPGGVAGTGGGDFKMIGQVEDTVQGGKLLDDEKDLTYSAPSPTPWK